MKLFKKKAIPVVLKDSDKIRNVIVQVDMKKGHTMVMSGFTAWENLALIMEALAVTAEQCVHEGMDRKEVYQEITDYLMEVMPSYTIKQESVN
ncbi:hypothetical protein HY468_05505 [Candidatus Roizmanbacteria bacterium]|nr:hypothetical protein [Candidatus Roizmanbacteria bacterium]